MITDPRPLPITLAPVGGETIGSYLGRLADANHLDPRTLPQLLGNVGNHRRDNDSPKGWASQTLLMLSALTTKPISTLVNALPALREVLAEPSKSTRNTSGTRRRAACELCMAGRGIRGLVVVNAQTHDCICLGHHRWLHGGDQHHLGPLPDLLQANRRHRRLARHADRRGATLDYLSAQRRTQKWFTTGHHELQHRWNQRLAALAEDPYGDPYHPNPDRIELATYPETVTLADLAASPYWTNHPDLSNETLRRLGVQNLGARTQ